MSETPRLLIGDRGGEIGLWLSKPRKNVKTCAEGDMLISSSTSADFRNLTYGAKGKLWLRGNGNETVAFGSPGKYGFAPIVWVLPFDNANLLLPSMQTGTRFDKTTALPPRYQIEMIGVPSAARITNLKSLSYALLYLIIPSDF